MLGFVPHGIHKCSSSKKKKYIAVRSIIKIKKKQEHNNEGKKTNKITSYVLLLPTCIALKEKKKSI